MGTVQGSVPRAGVYRAGRCPVQGCTGQGGAPCKGVQGREVHCAGARHAETGALSVRCNQESHYVSCHSNNCENERHFLL